MNISCPFVTAKQAADLEKTTRSIRERSINSVDFYTAFFEFFLFFLFHDILCDGIAIMASFQIAIARTYLEYKEISNDVSARS